MTFAVINCNPQRRGPNLHRHIPRYISHIRNCSWGCFYATSTSPYGPYKYQGVVVNTNAISPDFRMNVTTGPWCVANWLFRAVPFDTHPHIALRLHHDLLFHQLLLLL